MPGICWSSVFGCLFARCNIIHHFFDWRHAVVKWIITDCSDSLYNLFKISDRWNLVFLKTSWAENHVIHTFWVHRSTERREKTERARCHLPSSQTLLSQLSVNYTRLEYFSFCLLSCFIRPVGIDVGPNAFEIYFNWFDGLLGVDEFQYAGRCLKINLNIDISVFSGFSGF